MKFEDLTPEQQEQARACQTPGELLSLAKKVGVHLSEKELDDIAGGTWDCPYLYCDTYEICNDFRWE